MGKSRKNMNYQDLYYDGIIDYEDQFCEETQKIVKRKYYKDNRWDEIEEDWDDYYDDEFWENEED